ncbi:MAG: 50S ribosomal protein L18 [Caldilineaceae bacterium]|nr:50S ribosomal protein L18 [Caldilineaceae bacterium]
MAHTSRAVARKRRHIRVRRKVHGTAERPRLNIYRSLEHIYAQVIDDDSGRTLCATSTIATSARSDLAALSKIEQAKVVGKTIAEIARAQGIEQVVFDRGGFPYHGRVKALAEGSREGGLVF